MVPKECRVGINCGSAGSECQCLCSRPFVHPAGLRSARQRVCITRTGIEVPQIPVREPMLPYTVGKPETARTEQRIGFFFEEARLSNNAALTTSRHWPRM